MLQRTYILSVICSIGGLESKFMVLPFHQRCYVHVASFVSYVTLSLFMVHVT